MQRLSHGTRAYLVNTDGFPFPKFVSNFEIMPFLKKADEAGQLKHAGKYQVIDLNIVESKLEKIGPLPLSQKMDILGNEYPSLFIFILESFDKTERIEQYMKKCKAYEEDRYKYSLYVHGYFLVWLDQQRKEGKLKQGTLTHFVINGSYSKG